MRAAALCRIACLIVLAFTCFESRVRAEPQVSTIYLTSGGMLRGEVVMDMPGSPLTVMVAGQAVQVPRETISRIDPPAVVAPVAQPTVAPIAQSAYPAQPVAAPSAYPAQAVAAPPPPGSPIVLQVDRRGRAPVQSGWSPELQQLVLRRNDLAHSMKRKGLAAPITMLSLGAIGIIGTAAGAAAAASSYESCVADNAAYTSLSYRGCSNASGLIMAVGYSLSSALVAAGGTFLLVRLLRRKSLKRQLAAIDQDLRRFNVAPIAQVSPRAGATVRVAGLSLRTSF